MTLKEKVIEKGLNKLQNKKEKGEKELKESGEMFGGMPILDFSRLVQNDSSKAFSKCSDNELDDFEKRSKLLFKINTKMRMAFYNEKSKRLNTS